MSHNLQKVDRTEVIADWQTAHLQVKVDRGLIADGDTESSVNFRKGDMDHYGEQRCEGRLAGEFPAEQVCAESIVCCER